MNNQFQQSIVILRNIERTRDPATKCAVLNMERSEGNLGGERPREPARATE